MSSSRTNKRVRQQIVEDTDIFTPPPIEISRITIERILSKLSSLELKMDQTNTTLLNFSDKFSKFDDHLKNKPNDQNLISSAVKCIAKELIKIAIYPTQKQFLAKTEGFLSENYPEFYKRVSKKNWISYYETNIFPHLLEKHRSFRGTLSSRIKDTISEVQVAFAMALVEEFLNPKKDLLKIKEDTMQLRIEKYMDKFRNNSYEFSENEECSEEEQGEGNKGDETHESDNEE
ncbi:hypothetical protein C1646_751137 [Rhizophagus diaphanus]|nr:hypothetical protein C1646_751137 [Rhizophagus diaphanus] [Rhizophagus sp. MUCL 43196]